MAMGALSGAIAFTYTAYCLNLALKKPAKADSILPSTDPLVQSDAVDRKIVVRNEEGRELVPTGHSVVPLFPRTIELPSYGVPPQTSAVTTGSAPTEYTLVGLGLRTVTFIGFHVYLVGFYVATADVAALQSALVKRFNPIATTLVPGEREQLRNALLDPVQGEQIWEELLQRGVPARSAFRIAPVRDTDFAHLRDGFVRAVQSKTDAAVSDDRFGQAMRTFREVFNRGKAPKQTEILLVRADDGKLVITYDDGVSKNGRPSGRQMLGTVDEERISRALWLNYLAGKRVASEPARSNIVSGIMEFVERPIGTVATQVV
ncbi:hypothetical protein P8C59_003744 [Phyllachora maydis]|uniref:Chalcone isomerase domain-containing protein n=1 Tax=Phyllachora maydis TaxID=1825666 RepID=A0AAD9I0V8_9PEZI|nr:hypothetical protein P8C59_003744 [Phyllachora maydis]